MKKAILMSIKPEWLEKILNGEKTIEIRKTMPKCDLPIDVYLYCCRSNPFLYGYYAESDYNDMPISGFGYTTSLCAYEDENASYRTANFNSKVVAKFTLNKIEKLFNAKYFGFNNEFLNNCQLKNNEIDNYVGINKIFYAWYIENLQIFNKPMELSEFVNVKALSYDDWLYSIYNGHNGARNNYNSYLNIFRLKRPAQSWQYVWVKE